MAAYDKSAATIISCSKALVELDGASFSLSKGETVTSAVEAAVGTLHHLRLGVGPEMSPAVWAAVGTAVRLRSLDLYVHSDDPSIKWEDRATWDLPCLRRLYLDLHRCWRPEAIDNMFMFLGRCSFPNLQGIKILEIREVEYVGRKPVMEQNYFRSLPGGCKTIVDFLG
jgi:hypothetical protein